MKQIDVEELKKIQVAILDYFDVFCKKNSIHYWIDYGTLLGAVRHKGFIPWDDDVDIAMLRKDYEKAAQIFNKQEGSRYVFQTPSNYKDTCYPFGKLIDTSTTLYEYGESGIETGVYIDVFVYDNSPEDEKKVKKTFKKRDFLGRLRRLQLPMRKEVKGVKRLAYKVGASVLEPISRGVVNRALDRNARQFENQETKNVSTFTDPYDPTYFCVEKSIFQDLIEVEFEGKWYPAPRKYDYWLRVLYGNYMELPPIEKRVHQHSFEAFYKDLTESL